MIRDLSKEDYADVQKLVVQVHALHLENRPDVYRDVDPFGRAYFDFLLHSEKTIALVSEQDASIAGFCVVTLRSPPENPLLTARRVAYVEDLCVDAQCRNAGIGKALLAEAEQRSRSAGAETMELTVWSFNDAAVRFYENLGMSPRSVTMEKRL